MIYSQSAKRSIDIFSKTLKNHLQSGHFHSFRASIIPQYANQNRFMVRNYGSEAPVSEQMSLIKKLRERTSAPIKEVKAALVTCDWDIGKDFSFFLFVSCFGLRGFCFAVNDVRL